MTESRYRKLMTAIEDDGARAVRAGLDEAHRSTFPVWLVLYIGPVWTAITGLASYLAKLVVRAVIARISSMTLAEAADLIARSRADAPAEIRPPSPPELQRPRGAAGAIPDDRA